MFGVHDIDERSLKRAKKILKSKRIKVKNINVPKINEFYKPYIFQRKYKQPYIVGKIACSKDFFIKSSKSKYISNTYTQYFTHHLRYKNQAILVTYKTINEDNPLLDCRLSGLNEYSPIKVIIDKNLKVKKNANIFKLKNTKIIIFYNSGDRKKIKFLKSKKVKLINVKLEKNGEFDCIVPGSGGKDSFYAALKLKEEYGMNPLTITAAPHIYTNWGRRNFYSWIESGFSNYLFTPNIVI